MQRIKVYERKHGSADWSFREFLGLEQAKDAYPACRWVQSWLSEIQLGGRGVVLVTEDNWRRREGGKETSEHEVYFETVMPLSEEGQERLEEKWEAHRQRCASVVLGPFLKRPDWHPDNIGDLIG